MSGRCMNSNIPGDMTELEVEPSPGEDEDVDMPGTKKMDEVGFHGQLWKEEEWRNLAGQWPMEEGSSWKRGNHRVRS